MTVRWTAHGAAALVAAFTGFQASAETVGTAGVPTGFGLSGETLAFSVSGSYGSPRNPPADDTRFDASGTVMAGFGNPVDGLGLHGGVSVTSFRDFGASGSLTLGVHKMFQTSEAGIYSVALNATNLAPWGNARGLDTGVSLVGSYLTSINGRFALFSAGATTDSNTARDVDGVFGFGIGITDNLGLSIGQVGDRTALGVTLSPSLLAGNSVSISANHNHSTDENTLVIDIGRAIGLARN